MCITGNSFVQSCTNNVPSRNAKTKPRGSSQALIVLIGHGARIFDKTNVSEHLIKVITKNKPKILIGLNQKVCRQAQGISESLT